MGATASMIVQAFLSSAWVDLTPDTVAVEPLHIRYGIDGNRPDDVCASPGECSFTLRNDAACSGGVQGYYSPRHASKRTGWGYSVALRVVFTHGSATSFVTGITRSSQTATATTTGSHGLTTGDWVTMAGATQTEYNGVFQVTVTGGTTFTYTVAGSPATPATGSPTTTRAYVKFRGKVAVIDPVPGQYGPQRVHVVAYDGVYDLLEADAREIAYATNKTESEAIALVLDSAPSASQPIARSLDTGVDTFPVVFDKLGGGTKCLPLIRDLALSAGGVYFHRGDGTARLLNRHNRTLAASSYTFTNTMHGFVAPSGIDRAWNKIRVTAHPKTVSAAATDELYTKPTGDATILIASGATFELWVEFTDPNDRQTQIGGADVVTVLVGGTHYAANSAADGGGSSLTANIIATITPFASSALFSLQNIGGTAAYITVLKAIGKAVRDLGPQTAQKESTQDYGEHPLDIDLPYQSNFLLAKSYAEFIEAQFATLSGQLDSLEFIANDSGDFMTQALAREPGEAVTITEAVTGVSAVKAVVNAVEFDVGPKCWINVRWGLAPAAPWAIWQLGVAGATELGETTLLGF